MDEFYNKTVTLYNMAKGATSLDSDTWYPTLLSNVRLLINKGANIGSVGASDADSAKLSIKDEYLIKPYMKPIAWKNSNNKADYFTLDENSFFVAGDTTAESTASDDFFNYMKNKYDDCYKITTADRYELIPHFEVGGK